MMMYLSMSYMRDVCVDESLYVRGGRVHDSLYKRGVCEDDLFVAHVSMIHLLHRGFIWGTSTHTYHKWIIHICTSYTHIFTYICVMCRTEDSFEVHMWMIHLWFVCVDVYVSDSFVVCMCGRFMCRWSVGGMLVWMIYLCMSHGLSECVLSRTQARLHRAGARVHTHTCKYTHTHTLTHARTHTHTNRYAHTNTYVFTHVYICI